MIREPKFEQAKELGYNLLELAPGEKQKLQDRIEKWHGLVRIFVHPMYEKWRGNEEQYLKDPDKIKLVQIERVLAELLAMPEEKTPPIIIMEETAYASKVQEWLRDNPAGSSQNGVYFVKTCPNNSTPQLTDKEELTDEEKRAAWDKLIETLDDCGVKKILIGGMQLELGPYGINDWGECAPDWTGKDPYMSRCVGIAISYLSKDKAGKFDVELSALTDSGDGRNYFNNFKRKSGR